MLSILMFLSDIKKEARSSAASRRATEISIICVFLSMVNYWMNKAHQHQVCIAISALFKKNTQHQHRQVGHGDTERNEG